MGRIQRVGGATSAKPNPLLEREEFIDTTLKIKHIGLPNSTEMTLVNTEPGTAEKPLLKWSVANKRYEKISLAELLSEGVKKYVAKITQANTDSPELTEVHNTLGVTPIPSYVDVGVYSVTIAGGILDLDKTVINIIPNIASDQEKVTVLIAHSNTGYFTFTALNGIGNPTDSLLNNASIVIEIYS